MMLVVLKVFKHKLAQLINNKLKNISEIYGLKMN